MTTKKIILCEGSIYSTYIGFNRLISFYKKCLKHPQSVIEIDFSKTKWIDANMCAVLHAILYKLNKNQDNTFSIDLEYVRGRFDILFRNGFLRKILYIPDRFGTTVELTTFSKEDDEKFYDFINYQLMNHPGMAMTKKYRNEIIDSFLEVFVNVQLHARTDLPVFACGQYYPTKELLKFTLVDLGVGYLPPIRDYTNGKILDNRDAIMWALKGNSSKKDAPGGTGIKDILNCCMKTGSHLNIITGDSFWGTNLYRKKNKFREIEEFCGTTINLIFNCSK